MLKANPEERMTFEELFGEKMQQYIEYLKDGRKEELHAIEEAHKNNSKEDDDLKLSLIREKISFKINAAKKERKPNFQNILEICNKILSERNKVIFFQRIA